ncbi:MAG: SRPBCC family protein [Myxococcota bacterium]|nr:SRPBCC family protein [Myxococcota bacterium]
MRWRVVAAAALGAVLSGGSSGRADGLSRAEAVGLLRGETILRGQTLDRADRHYSGGVTYTIVDGRTDELRALLFDLREWQRFLPMARGARLVGVRGGDPLVEITHEAGFFHTEYTMEIRRSGDTVRFWLDLSRPHDVEDAWGFFRAEPLGDGRTLVTYGILIDLGPGLLHDWFEKRVRALALNVPQRVRGLMQERRRLAYDALAASGVRWPN